MAIVKMKKLQLAAVQSQRDEILRELMLLGCVEISEPCAAPDPSCLRS
jgi:V/A-type H+-transporting ATPase subunit I